MAAGGRLTLSVLMLVLAVSACESPLPPPVAVREPSLEAEDITVLRALFDDFRRAWREALRPPHGPPPRFLVVDTTMTMCRRDPAILGPQPGRCMEPAWVTVMSEVVPARLARTVVLRFPMWTAERLSIAGPLGDDVTLVSATLLDSIVPGDLLRRYPSGSTIVRLSAVGYPAPRMAVVAFSGGTSFGGARMERQPDGRWIVAGRVTRSVD